MAKSKGKNIKRMKKMNVRSKAYRVKALVMLKKERRNTIIDIIISCLYIIFILFAIGSACYAVFSSVGNYS